jgi:hypothetical protein
VKPRGEKPGEKPRITHRIVAIGFSLCVLVALDLNRGGFLCAFFLVHNGWRLSAGDILLEGPSIILIGAL